MVELPRHFSECETDRSLCLRSRAVQSDVSMTPMPMQHNKKSDAPYVPPQRIGFKNLTEGERARYTIVVGEAMRQFGMSDFQIERLVRHTNITAQVTTPGRPPMALRMRTGHAVSVDTEFTWLSAVRFGTSIQTVAPYFQDVEANTVLVTGSESEPTIECSLFFWAEGEPLASHLNNRNYRLLGAMSAELHQFASNWTPPAGLKPLKWDKTMYYEGTRLVLADADYTHLIPDRQAHKILQVVTEADTLLRRLSQLPNPIFLHGNIEMWNVLVDESGCLRLMDFEDVMLGHPIHDVAITLYYGAERDDYLELRDAFKEGYTSMLPWPINDQRELELLVAARAAMLLNHAILTEDDPAPVIRRLLPLITRCG